MTDSENLILDIFEHSARTFSKVPPLTHANFAAWQAHAAEKNYFIEDRGVTLTSLDTSEAGRKKYSRMRLSLERQGLIRINRLSPTTSAVCLTLAGLKVAEDLAGERAPADLRKAIKAMEKAAKEQAGQ